MMASIAPLLHPACSSPEPSQRRPNAAVRYHHKPWIDKSCVLLFFVLVCLLSGASATRLAAPIPTETLEVDLRIPVLEQGSWVTLSPQEHELRRLGKRHTFDPPPVTTTYKISALTITEASTTTTIPASPLPSPLDSSLSTNFSSKNGHSPCPTFINSFLTDPIFKQCYPFSLLLQGSRSFFEAEKSLVSITEVLDATCAANSTFCSLYLNDLAKNLTKPSTCGPDYQLGNSVVVQAYMSMIAYQPLYSASCLRDQDTNSYCYANAVTNLTTPANVYFYFLPLNISLPGSSIPTCNGCLERTMAIFQAASANRKLPIASTYVSAAKQVNTICGPGFVNDTLPNPITTSAGIFSPVPSYWLLIALLTASAVNWFG
ncbi:hypothetical protein VTK73DRAFT_4175 [Phialemonium thermophilum]|uniref:DUF7729 domain-containing protein n=1 Tax=Phialemonium thermophilum TaxID=223376 RepID=A0ABR3Y0E3_9PEZI